MEKKNFKVFKIAISGKTVPHPGSREFTNQYGLKAFERGSIMEHFYKSYLKIAQATSEDNTFKVIYFGNQNCAWTSK